MSERISALIQDIGNLPEDWHGAGTVSLHVLHAIAGHALRLGGLRRSVETGSGKTTLLLSHLSADHTVFAVDAGRSISQVRESPLFNAHAVTFVEGPTQRTLPRHTFAHTIQFALIDGPHGYPFPDLEYYYLYPIIERGGMLLLDDIKIPSIRRMFDIINADEMFELLEVVDDNMAFFRRTSVPCIDPESDSWWLQGYNRGYYDALMRPPAAPPAVAGPAAAPVSTTLGTVRRMAPRWLARLAPPSIKRRLRERM